MKLTCEIAIFRKEENQKEKISYSFGSRRGFNSTVLVSRDLISSDCPSLTNHTAIESPPSTSLDTPLPLDSPSISAASHQPTTRSEQGLVRLELERQQDSEQTARQMTRPSGKESCQTANTQAADVIQGLRMMQIRRGTSESRRGRVTYELPDL